VPCVAKLNFKLIINKTFQFPAAGRMSQLTKGFGLNLADAFTGDRKILPDFFQGVIGFLANSKAHPQHFLLARR